ncbi:MAG: NfeD family protein [Pseudomonadota bacterium]
MEHNVMIVWLVVGVIFLIAEIGVPGVGLLFAGLGALTVGMGLNFLLIPLDDILLQILVFVVSTALWALVLWKPMQKLKLGKTKASYHNIIGDTASVGEKGISKTHGGEVVWSGAIMKAKLAESSPVEKLESGAQVVIKDITGNVLTVAPK